MLQATCSASDRPYVANEAMPQDIPHSQSKLEDGEELFPVSFHCNGEPGDARVSSLAANKGVVRPRSSSQAVDQPDTQRGFHRPQERRFSIQAHRGTPIIEIPFFGSQGRSSSSPGEKTPDKDKNTPRTRVVGFDTTPRKEQKET